MLVGVVETLRHEIEEMGGTFHFRSKVTDLVLEKGQLKEIEINGEQRIPAQVCVLAVGTQQLGIPLLFEKESTWSQNPLQ